jgi:pimeloyl-ACP methyl ester carboxylesterase
MWRCSLPDIVVHKFNNGPVELAYIDEGDGEPVVLVHGFASNKEVNWVNPGWVTTLTGAGRRAIAFDNRGHGASTKLYDPALYHTVVMADDIRALLDHLGLAHADVMGYSMGARNAAFLAQGDGDRVRSLILGGCGIHLVKGGGLPLSVADALEAPSDGDVTDPLGRTARAFADQTRSDRLALAACLRGSRQPLVPSELAQIKAPVLIAVGTRDDIAGSPHELAALIPGSSAVDIPGRDHFLSVGDRVFKEAALKFLAERP